MISSSENNGLCLEALSALLNSILEAIAQKFKSFISMSSDVHQILLILKLDPYLTRH